MRKVNSLIACSILAISASAFAADGKLLASGSRDTTVLVWNVDGVLRKAKTK